jgi:hypothetical protein
MERAVLLELADTVSYAITAVESRKALVSDVVAELEFTLSAPEFRIAALTDDLECELVHANTVPLAGGGLRAFFHTRGAAPEDVIESTAEFPLHDLTLLSDQGEGDERVCRFEAVQDAREESLTGFYASLTEDLTDRQLETLRTAHCNGYFETPRTQIGSEIAPSMEITQPTFNNHLRTAQRKLYQRLFDTDSAASQDA